MRVPADVAVVVPIKSFRAAKSRLAGALSDTDRRALAERCAEVVLGACQPLTVFVVCDDPEVAAWAQRRGANVASPGKPGLNEAVKAGRATARHHGYERVLIVHGDLPHAQPLSPLADESAEVVIVPDRRSDGTNALLVPSTDEFVFHYGPGSFDAHVTEARRCGLSVRVVNRADLALDIDTLDDLRAAGIVDQTGGAPDATALDSPQK